MSLLCLHPSSAARWWSAPSTAASTSWKCCTSACTARCTSTSRLVPVVTPFNPDLYLPFELFRLHFSQSSPGLFLALSHRFVLTRARVYVQGVGQGPAARRAH